MSKNLTIAASLLAVLASLLLTAQLAKCQTAFPVNDIILQNVSSFAKVVPLGNVRVCTINAVGTPCTPLATIYSSAGLTAQRQPFTADVNGNYHYYVLPGCYIEQTSIPSGAANPATFTRTVCLYTGTTANVCPTGQFAVGIADSAGTLTCATPTVVSPITSNACPGGQYASGITAPDGTLTCGTPAGAGTSVNACSAGQFATGITDAVGTLSCDTPPTPTQIYMISATFGGIPASSQALVLNPAAVTFVIPQNCTNSRLEVVTAPTLDATFDLNKCTGAGFTTCSSIGTAVVSSGNKAAAFTCASATTFTAGSDAFTLTAPSSPDVSMADIGASIYATR